LAQRAPDGPLDQQLRGTYPAGTVLVIKLKGLVGVNSECAIAPASSFKGGKLHHMGFFQAAAATSNQCLSRTLALGSAVSVWGTLVQARFNRVDLLVADLNDGYKAQVWFEFPKGSLPATDFKAVQAVIETVFSIQNGPPPQQQVQQAAQPEPPLQPQPPVPATASLGAIYVNSQLAADRLQLNPGGSFSLTEAGQAFSGNYSVNGNTLKLHIVQLDKDVDIAIDGDKLIVNGSEIWVQPK
jgi:hypothetical protein